MIRPRSLKILFEILLLLAPLLQGAHATSAIEESMNLYYPDDRLRKILGESPQFRSFEEEEACERLVKDLSIPEQEVAARTSYAYFYAATTGASCISEDVRHRMAMKEARRHLIGEGGDYDKALAALKINIDYRNEHNLDVLRLCLVKDASFDNEEDKVLCDKYQFLIKEELPNQFLIIRGHDKQRRPIIIVRGRESTECNEEGYVLTRLLLVERATATVEYLTEGRVEKITVIFQMGGYQKSNLPPLAAVKKLVVMFQRMYPERLKRFIILDPPFWLNTLYYLVKLFLSDVTKEKIVMVKGEAEKTETLSALVDKEQAEPFMLSDGKLISQADAIHFVHNIPFFCLYDDAHCHRKDENAF